MMILHTVFENSYDSSDEISKKTWNCFNFKKKIKSSEQEVKY